MPKLPHISGLVIVKALERLGFEKLRQSGSQRLELPITVTVTAPGEYGDEPVARITQVLSLKNLGVSQ
jgi:predicted RNA binding protein YcfA (HicA-like mRNA interferase family)